jgi:hypothetical protein
LGSLLKWEFTNAFKFYKTVANVNIMFFLSKSFGKGEILENSMDKKIYEMCKITHSK